MLSVFPSWLTQACAAGSGYVDERRQELSTCLGSFNAASIRRASERSKTEKSDSSLAILTLAERMSRRDPGTEIGLINLAAREGRTSEALRHYDHLLSAHPLAGSALFPALVAALESPDITRNLKTMAARPWYGAFLLHAAKAKGNAEAIVDLTLAMSALERTSHVEHEQVLAIAAALSRSGEIGAAERLLKSSRGVDSDYVLAFDFNSASTDPRLIPLTWSLRQDGIGFVDLKTDGTLQINAVPVAKVTIAKRTTALEKGRYRLSLSASTSAESGGAAVIWSVSCPERKVGWRQVLQIGHVRKASDAEFSIDESCMPQSWTVDIVGPDTQPSSLVWLGPIRLERL